MSPLPMRRHAVKPQILSIILCALLHLPSALAEQLTPSQGFEIVNVYPHDPTAFTQGLLYLNGFLYESTGLYGQSSLRKVALETGAVLQKSTLSAQYFGEGIAHWNGKLIGLTYQHQLGFVYDLRDFKQVASFDYPGEGWGLTHDGTRLIMSDGTAQLRFWDPQTLRETGRLNVTDAGRPVANLNELEWVKGEIYANIWQSNRIARIHPVTGKVLGWIDLTGLLSPMYRRNVSEDVLNGIAYDSARDRLFVTGKKWPKLFEIRIRKH